MGRLKRSLQYKRLKSGLKKNSTYYRIRRFVRRLVSDPLRYYFHQKLKYYPHEYARHFEIKAASPPPPLFRTSETTISNVVDGPAGISNFNIPKIYKRNKHNKAKYRQTMSRELTNLKSTKLHSPMRTRQHKVKVQPKVEEPIITESSKTNTE